MKKKILTIFTLLAVFGFSTVFAKDILVEPGEGTISLALNGNEESEIPAAEDGDVLILTGGVYLEHWSLELSINVTIKAASGLSEKPIVKMTHPENPIIPSHNIFSFHFLANKTVIIKGIKFDGTKVENAFWLGSANNANSNYSKFTLEVDDCDFNNFTKIFSPEAGALAPEKLKFTNCKFVDVGENALFFRESPSNPGAVEELIVEHCTFWNITGIAIDVTAHDQNYSTPDPKVTIDHVNIYNVHAGWQAVLLRHCDGATVKNCIFTQPLGGDTDGDGEPDPVWADPLLLYGANSVAHNNNFFRMWSIQLFDGATSNNLSFDDVAYVDEINGDLNLQSGSPAIGAADDGSNLGDHYWDGSAAPVPVELTTFTANVVKNNVVLNWETATEVNNYGFNVERASSPLSMTSAKDWNKVAFIEGHGNSNSPKYYSYSDKLDADAGTYFYRLKQLDIDGTFEYSDVVEVTLGVPNSFELRQNYPNPFNPTTSIKFSITEASKVKLSVYNIVGELVIELVNKNMEAGYHKVNFDATELNSGVYLYKIEAGNFSEIKKMMLIK